MLLAGATALVTGGLGWVLGYQQASGAAEQAAAASVAAAAAQDDARLSDAMDACRSSDDGNTLTLSDGGQTIVVDTRSEYGDPSGMQCVLTQLDTPQSTTAAMGRTTSLMGVQEDERDGITYSWSYHPDNGVNMVITLDD